MSKRLYRSLENRMIAGVCGGIAEYMDLDPTIVRLAWVVMVFGLGFGILAYIVAWIIVPERTFEQPKMPKVSEYEVFSTSLFAEKG